jgi:PDZ domain
MRDASQSLILAASLAVGLVRGGLPSPTATFPFVYDDGRVFVPVRLGHDTTQQWFILDTGVPETTVDVGTAARFGLTTTDGGMVSGAGAHEMRTGRAAPIAVSVGGVPIAAPFIEVNPIDSLLFPYSGIHAPGVIGAQFFREHVVELDFDAHVVRVYDPATYGYHGPGAVLPLTFTGTAPLVTGSLTLPGGARKPMHLLADIGAKANLLVAEPFIRANGLRDAFPQRMRTVLGSGVGGETRYDFVRVPALTFGTPPQAAIHEFVAGLSAEGTLKSTYYDGLLGAEFFSHYLLIFDYSRNQLILAPRRVASPPAEADMSGIYLKRIGGDPGHVVVHHIVPDSPADRAGIRTGDVVERVNGATAAGTSLWPWRSALRSGDGDTVTVTTERDGDHRTTRFALHKLV